MGEAETYHSCPSLDSQGPGIIGKKIILREAGKGVPSALSYGVFGEKRVLYFYPVPVFSTVLVLSIGPRLETLGPRLETLGPYPRPNKTGTAILAVQE